MLKYSYTVLAPIYDALVNMPTAGMRQHSLAKLVDTEGKRILLAGVGTGLDFAYLPRDASYVGVDFTTNMLKRARQRVPADLQIELQQGDVMAMPFADNEFDIVIMHLILAVVSNPVRALSEAARIVKPQGTILILDKFIRPGQWAPMRRLLNVFMQFIATRTDVVFEKVLAQVPALQLESDETTATGGWFRHIVLSKS